VLVGQIVLGMASSVVGATWHSAFTAGRFCTSVEVLGDEREPQEALPGLKSQYEANEELFQFLFHDHPLPMWVAISRHSPSSR